MHAMKITGSNLVIFATIALDLLALIYSGFRILFSVIYYLPDRFYLPEAKARVPDVMKQNKQAYATHLTSFPLGLKEC